ncbi:MAG: adenylosuccinate lyase family protein [Actinomycetota bacterium]|nr:adenylosuccinate lyase family protein [Actinomycetota bacterium]
MGAHLTDSIVYGHLWSTSELHAAFDDDGRFQSWLDILAALAEAQAEVGLVPPAAASAIRAHADISLLDLAAVAEETRATGHSTLGLIRCLQAVLPAEAREWVYYGATVQDISDTWAALMMRMVGEVLLRDLSRLESACLSLAAEHRDTIMCGRTHGQPGLPITFGLKAAVWASEVARHRSRLAEGRARWEVVQLGGALGTMQFWGPSAVPLLESFADRLGLAAPDIAWITARDRVAEFLGLLAMVTATLGKVGNEIYQLQRPEIGEVSEPFTPGQVGSITMPHKRNPELSEHLGTLARLVRADAAVAVEGMVHEHERDGRAWKAEWLVFPEACLLTGVSLSLGARLLEGLVVHGDRMRANLDAREGYVLSEPVLRVLSAKIGKHAAHAAVYAATMAGIERGVSFADALRADPAVAGQVSEDELSACLDPYAALGATSAFIERVLAAAERPPPPPTGSNIPDIAGSRGPGGDVIPDIAGLSR